VKLRNVRIKALPANMPESITMDISGIELGKSIKVASIDTTDFEILNNPRVTIASVDVPRALKGIDDEEEDEEGVEGGEDAASPETSEATE
jgi:large subunit ribosomal protein L25